MLRCGGSSHCKFYAEDEKTSKKIQRDNRTQTEIDTENRHKYVETLKPKMEALVSSSDGRRYISVQCINICFVCGSKLLELGKQRKQCTLCQMEYIDKNVTSSKIKSIDNHFVYVMGLTKPENIPESPSKDRCQFCNEIGKCCDKDSPLYQKQCKPKYCDNLKKQAVRLRQLEENAFTGVKNIPISKIILRNNTLPRQSKIDRAVETIQRNGGIIKPVYVELVKDKYLLKDGYIRYYAALQCGLTEIPATFEYEREGKK